jgi:hypothetical protein
MVNVLFSSCLAEARNRNTTSLEDGRVLHAVETMSVMMRCILAKENLTGWEVMEIFGGLSESDAVFMVRLATLRPKF